MAVHSEHGLLVYLDATPDEQLQEESDLTLALTGLICDQDEGLENLKQFKDTPFSDRIGEARRILNSLEDGSLTLYTISMAATFGGIEQYAMQQEPYLQNIMTLRGNRYYIDGKRLSRNTALAMVWYAVAKNLIGLWAAKLANKMNLSRVTLLLDPLPSVPGTSLNLLQKISTESDLALLWKKTIDETGVHFQISYMQCYSPREGEPERPGKEHPHAILADWISHSLFASFEDNQESFLQKHTTRTPEEKSEYLAAVKDPWFWLHKNKRDLLIPLDSLRATSPEEIERLKSELIK